MDEKVMGLNPVIELLRSGGRPVGTILIDHEKGGKQFEEIIGLAKSKSITVKMVPKSALDSLSGLLRHQGAIAIVAPKEYSDPYVIVEEALRNKKAPIVLVLDGVEDPHNLGAVIRTAESAGVDCVIIPEHRAAHLTAAVARASAGALEHMPIGKVTNLVNYIDFLKEKGFWVIGLSGESRKDYTAFDMTVPIAAVMGSEGTGIRPIVEKACDEVVSLPMMGKVSSLNVSVAAGVLLYEVVRQRKAALAKS
jgi:23S rRNA (guanosine2251-2'-O)-methyltransferase